MGARPTPGSEWRWGKEFSPSIPEYPTSPSALWGVPTFPTPPQARPRWLLNGNRSRRPGRAAALSGALRPAAMLNKPGKAGRVLRLSNAALSSSGRPPLQPHRLEKLICFRRPGGNKSTFRSDSLRDYSRESPANPCFRMKSAQLCTRGVRGELPATRRDGLLCKT